MCLIFKLSSKEFVHGQIVSGHCVHVVVVKLFWFLFDLRNYPLTALGKSELLMLHREILLVQSEYQRKTSDVFK